MNEQLKILGTQLTSIWKQIGISQRITLILGGLVVFLGLAGLGWWSTQVSYGLLYGKMEDAEASKVVAALDELKVPYQITGGQIHVPVDQVHFLRMKLIERGLPRGEGVGYELFDRSNFGLSDFLQRANYVRAVQTELARSIVLMDGVESARVFVVIPENRLLLEAQKRPTASVLIRTRGSAPPPTATVHAIRNLVANAVEGLQAGQVAVMDNRGNTLAAEDGSDAVGGLSTGQLNVRRQYEHYLAHNAETLLEKVLGPGQAVVRVAAELSFDSGRKEDERYDPEGQVATKEEVRDKKNDTEAPQSQASGGVAAAPSGPVAATNAAAGPQGNTSSLSEKTTTTTYAVTKSTTSVIQPPGTLKRLSAAVFVNARSQGEGAARKTVARPAEELEKLKRIVQSAIGIQIDPASTRKDELTLEEMPFNDQFEVESTRQLRQEEWLQTGLNLARNLGYPLLAVALLMMFFKTLKKTSADAIPVGLSFDEAVGSDHPGTPGMPGRPRKPEVVTVGVLNRLMKENPDNMSMALRNWINRNKPNE